MNDTSFIRTKEEFSGEDRKQSCIKYSHENTERMLLFWH